MEKTLTVNRPAEMFVARSGVTYSRLYLTDGKEEYTAVSDPDDLSIFSFNEGDQVEAALSKRGDFVNVKIKTEWGSRSQEQAAAAMKEASSGLRADSSDIKEKIDRMIGIVEYVNKKLRDSRMLDQKREDGVSPDAIEETTRSIAITILINVAKNL